MKQLAMSLVFSAALASVAIADYPYFDSWARLRGKSHQGGTYMFNLNPPFDVNIDYSPSWYPSNHGEFATNIGVAYKSKDWDSSNLLDTYNGIGVISGTPTFAIEFQNIVQSGSYAIAFYVQSSSGVSLLAQPYIAMGAGGLVENGPAFAMGVTRVGGSLAPLMSFNESIANANAPVDVGDTQIVLVRGFMTVSQNFFGSRGTGFFVPLGTALARCDMDKEMFGRAPDVAAGAGISVQVLSYSFAPAQNPWPLKPGSSNTSGGSRGFRTTFKDSSGNVLHDSSYAMPFDRESIDLPTLGTYSGSGTLTLESTGILRKIVPMTVVNGAVQIGSDIEVHGGDINGDNEVDLLDYFVLSEFYGLTADDDDFYNVTAEGLTGFDADLNFDDSVDLLDYMIISDNYNLSGD